MKLFALATLSALLATASAIPAYSDHAVLSVTPSDDHELKQLLELGLDLEGLDWFMAPRAVGVSADVYARPGTPAVAPVRKLLARMSNVSVLIPDLRVLIARDYKDRDEARARVKGAVNFTRQPDRYLDYEETMEWMFLQEALHGDICSVSQVGSSHEGRPIYVLKLHGRAPSRPDKPQLYTQAVLHAREWIGAGTLNFMMKELLEGYGNVDRITRLVDNMDLAFNLVANPDGYQFSHGTGGRMWRKTRSPNPGSTCIGTDPNRNWITGWAGPGASNNPCSESFYGPSAASEPEVSHIVEYARENVQALRLGGFCDLHSFGQMWLSPYGNTLELPEDYPAMEGMMRATTQAITAVHGSPYIYGSISNTIYVASGGSIDTTYGEDGIVYSTAAELRPIGQPAFIVPFDQVQESGEETLAGMLAMGEYILANPQAKAKHLN